MKIFFCVPPTGKYIRDERCQLNISSRTAENIREPVQLLYLCGLLKQKGNDVLLRDYSVENFALKDIEKEIADFDCDFFVLESAQGAFKDDLNFVKLISGTLSKTHFVIKTPFADKEYLQNQTEHPALCPWLLVA